MALARDTGALSLVGGPSFSGGLCHSRASCLVFRYRDIRVHRGPAEKAQV